MRRGPYVGLYHHRRLAPRWPEPRPRFRHHFRHDHRHRRRGQRVLLVTVQATDGAADVSDSQTFQLGRGEPRRSSPGTSGAQTNYDGDTGVSLQLSGSAADGNPVTYSLTAGALPSGLTLDSDTGDITGDIPASGDDGSYAPTITGVDRFRQYRSHWTPRHSIHDHGADASPAQNPGGYDNLDGDSVSGDSLLEYDNATSYLLTARFLHTVGRPIPPPACRPDWPSTTAPASFPAPSATPPTPTAPIRSRSPSPTRTPTSTPIKRSTGKSIRW